MSNVLTKYKTINPLAASGFPAKDTFCTLWDEGYFAWAVYVTLILPGRLTEYVSNLPSPLWTQALRTSCALQTLGNCASFGLCRTVSWQNWTQACTFFDVLNTGYSVSSSYKRWSGMCFYMYACAYTLTNRCVGAHTCTDIFMHCRCLFPPPVRYNL